MEPYENQPAPPLQNALVALAGAKTELKFDPARHGHSWAPLDDLTSARELIKPLLWINFDQLIGEQERVASELLDAFIEHLAERAGMIVNLTWPEIQKLAAELSADGRVEGARAEAILSGES